jgi:glycerophosphoryl diester phosphodiesterase
MLSSCTQNELDIQGHRGCRGLYPENTIEGFKKAIDLGVTTLEMDVVVSGDGKLVLSHEPWFSPEICAIAAENEEEARLNFNIFQWNYSDIARIDCGSKVHPRFPEQAKVLERKPLLTDLIEEIKAHCLAQGKPLPWFNIEIKSRPEVDGIFHPKPEIFAEMLWAVVRDFKLQKRTTIQSFDVRPLQYLHKKHPEALLVLLVENDLGLEKNFELLGFYPYAYSPHYPLVNVVDVEKLNRLGIKTIPWTVNDIEEAKKLVEMGVHGIITDYPDRISIQHLRR